MGLGNGRKREKREKRLAQGLMPSEDEAANVQQQLVFKCSETRVPPGEISRSTVRLFVRKLYLEWNRLQISQEQRAKIDDDAS